MPGFGNRPDDCRGPADRRHARNGISAPEKIYGPLAWLPIFTGSNPAPIRQQSAGDVEEYPAIHQFPILRCECLKIHGPGCIWWHP